MTSALVSGGKDSIYSASLAEAQGWPVDELVVLEPADVDSFLFHTPNLALVRKQAEAWGKPVRFAPIDGTGEGAETGALRTALASGRGPVVAGAIASSYQWSRLSRVTFELGRPLYVTLWGKEPGRVVRAEIASGLDIRLVQLAAEGLGEGMLGERLDLSRLQEIESLAGTGRSVHPAGEGGEFETLVVDAPFFAQRIQLDATRIVRRGLARRLEVTDSHLEPKGPSGGRTGRGALR